MIAATLPTPNHEVLRRALVVDDEPLIRWWLSETLQHQGYSVVEAGDARSAIREASETRDPFGLVMLDVKLPDSDDLSLLVNLRRMMAEATIILMTAHSTPELARNALELGARCVLNKPFGMGEIEALVEPVRVGARRG